MNLIQLLQAILPATILSQLDHTLEIKGLVTDNRDVEDSDCFIALAGITHHGKQFIDDAVRRGACVVLVESDDDGIEFKVNQQKQKIPVISLSNLKANVNALLIRFYDVSSSAFDMRLFGVTGTNGKSSITRFVAQMSADLGQSAGLMGTLGFGVWPDVIESKNTTPELAVLLRQFSAMQKAGAQVVAMEVSSHGIEQQRIEGLTFDSAVFANLSQDHLDYHGDMESYFAIKRELFIPESLQYAIINIDDVYGQRLLADDAITAQKISYGFSEQADIRVVNWAMHATSIDADIVTPWGGASFTINMVGDFNLANVLAAIGLLCVENKFSFQEIITSIQSITPAPGRMQTYCKQGSVPVVVDFAHTPDALENVLSTLSKQVEGQLAVVFGCGGNRDAAKRPLMASVAQNLADVICFTADNPRDENLESIINDMQAGLLVSNNALVQVEHDRQQAIVQTINILTENDILLVAGKGHEQYQEIAGAKNTYSDEAVLFSLGYQDSSSLQDSLLLKNKTALDKEALL